MCTDYPALVLLVAGSPLLNLACYDAQRPAQRPLVSFFSVQHCLKLPLSGGYDKSQSASTAP